MGLFRRKKKRNDALFGEHIEPDCAYCAYSIPSGGELRCHIGKLPENFSCKSFLYDPLKREPKGEPKLQTHSAEDFKL